MIVFEFNCSICKQQVNVAASTPDEIKYYQDRWNQSYICKSCYEAPWNYYDG